MDKLKFRTQKELANYLGVTIRTIRRWERSGLIKKSDGVFYDPEIIDELMQRNALSGNGKVGAGKTLAAAAIIELRKMRAEFDKRFDGFEDIFTRFLEN